MDVIRAAASGLVGASALTLLHETARRTLPYAPRMDILGMRAISKLLRGIGQEPPPRKQLHSATLVGDIVSNALYYGFAGAGSPEDATRRGTLLGLAAGIGAVVLPGPLGLGTAPSARTTATKAMTVAWYTVGGLVAGAVFRQLSRAQDA